MKAGKTIDTSEKVYAVSITFDYEKNGKDKDQAIKRVVEDIAMRLHDGDNIDIIAEVDAYRL